MEAEVLAPLYSLSLTSGSLPNCVSWCHTASVLNVFVSGGAGCLWMWWGFYKLKPRSPWGSRKMSLYWASFFLSSASSLSSTLECSCHVHQGPGRHLYYEPGGQKLPEDNITERQQIFTSTALKATMFHVSTYSQSASWGGAGWGGWGGRNWHLAEFLDEVETGHWANTTVIG